MSLKRGSGQWGLLGGSSSSEKAPKSKSSKLANLARSSRGAFDKRGSKLHANSSTRLDSVSRLASLNSGSRSQRSPVAEVTVPETRPISSLVIVNPQSDALESTNVKAFTDPSADHLIAQPSLFADSLFHLWGVPQDVANSLLRIYANPYLLTVTNEAQLRKAFSTSSPDDIVRNAQLGKRISLNWMYLMYKTLRSMATQDNQTSEILCRISSQST